MSDIIKISTPQDLQGAGLAFVPKLFAATGNAGVHKFIDFFTAEINNPNTRLAYAQAVTQFARWCEQRGLRIEKLTPTVVAAYLEWLGRHPKGPQLSPPSVKQHLAAIRRLFDYLVIGQIIPLNPAHAVKGPKHVVKKGKTPVLTAAETKQLFDAIDHDWNDEGRKTKKRNDQLTLLELRDRALLGVLFYSFARVTAVVRMNVDDYFFQEGRGWFRLHEKGGKEHSVPAHHTAEAYMNAYFERTGIAAEKGTPLFRSFDRQRQLTGRRLARADVWQMIQRRAKNAGLSTKVSCHTARATGITVYLQNGGQVEHAQKIAAHESPRTTKLYDRREDKVSLDEIERIRF